MSKKQTLFNELKKLVHDGKYEYLELEMKMKNTTCTNKLTYLNNRETYIFLINKINKICNDDLDYIDETDCYISSITGVDLKCQNKKQKNKN